MYWLEIRAVQQQGYLKVKVDLLRLTQTLIEESPENLTSSLTASYYSTTVLTPPQRNPVEGICRNFMYRPISENSNSQITNYLIIYEFQWPEEL